MPGLAISRKFLIFRQRIQSAGRVVKFSKIEKTIWLILVLLCLRNSSPALDNPSPPQVYVNGTGQLEVFWFYPGIHRTEYGNIQNEPDRFLLPPSGEHRYAIMTRFDIVPPVYVDNISCYLFGGDPQAASDGFYPPLRLALKGRTVDNIWNDIAFDTVRVDADQINCEIVKLPVGKIIPDLFGLWTSFEYTEINPVSPLLGGSLDGGFIEQYLCDMVDSSYNLKGIDGLCLAGLEASSWYGDLSDEYRDMRFSLLYSGSERDLRSDVTILGGATAEKMQIVIPMPTEGTLTVRADSGNESSFSEPFLFDPGAVAPIIIEPPLVELSCGPSGECHFSMSILNNHTSVIELRLNCENDSITTCPAFDTLEPGETGVFDVNVMTGNEVGGISHPYIIVDCGNEFYPLKYNINVRVSQPTDISENEPKNIPGTFDVSQPFPNPFNGAVSFRLDHPNRKSVRVTVYNLLGRKIAETVLAGKGDIDFTWDGTGQNGEAVTTGLYLFRFSAEGRTIIRKALYLK